jgi:iron complex transport system substrate-binding protein
VRARVVVFTLLLMLGVACGSGSPERGGAGAPRRSPAGSGGFPTRISSEGRKVTIEERPTRIISLSPTATEMIFAIGAGDQVVAVDDNSNYPPEAPTTDLSGIDPNIEAIASYEPDLVVYSNDPGDLARGLETLGIPALLQPAAVALEDTYSQIRQLGKVTGHTGEAAALVRSMQSEIEEIVASVPETEEPRADYYYELDDTYFSVTSETFVGRTLALLGIRNIADEADEDGSGYPQLSAEYIIEADPDLIFLADTKCCNQSAETVSKRPGWDRISAVETGSIVELDDDVASRWGPRIVDLLRAGAEAVASLRDES